MIRFFKSIWFRRFLRIGVALLILVLLADRHVTHKTSDYCYSSVEATPHAHVGVVLGTSPKLVDGRDNLYFKYRIEAATKLFLKGKIDRILVSGDNRTIYYNEPEEMRKALLENGVPPDRIHLDYAGLRTFDSMVRTKEVFQQDSVIVISQAFHNQRATYIARAKGIHAIGFNAKDVSVSFGLKTRIREALARTKMVLDVYVLGTEPRHLGPQEHIPAD
ncbi:MAG: YdcF family protein [Flavobacteriia bacterium]|nr:YdcF family protein [Flavobacteriia bacterium]